MNVNGMPPNLSSTTAPEPAKNTLDGDGFLTLLMAQLGNQDPTSPVETTQFMEQLTSLNTVQQLVTANENLEGLMTGMTSLNNENAVNLVGKEVTAVSSSFSLAEGETETLEFDLPSNARNIKVSVYNSNGTVVGSITRDEMGAGPQTVEWEGDPGDYTFRVEAENLDGDPLPAITTYATGVVAEIRFDAGFPVLVIDGRHVPLSDVVTVRPAPGPESGGGPSETETETETTPQNQQSTPFATAAATE
jgi:flagellar basal-body rod modification protein FlgD